ncbi:MAG: hypothetical protein NUW21_09400, partial [Elusimicrobia bacterium]|nr:hypothetical protein [Elusimicrobiota bacterium]
MRRRALLTGALALAAALRLAWVIGSAGASFDRRHHCGEGTDRNVEAGHALLHGLPHERVFWSMPAQTAANALMCRRSRPAEVLAAPAAALLLNGLLVFGLGALLAGGTAGAAALALYAWISVPAHAFNDRWLFTTSLLLVAFLAVWRARAPSTRKTALLAAAVGFSLNVLSVLFLLPPLLALREWLARGRPRPQRLKNAALLLVVPWLFLLPWALASGTFRETGRSDANVIGGALGLTLTMGPGDERALAGIAPGESVLTWAAAEVARHPLRYLHAVARRFLFASSLQPLLLLLAAFAALPLRRRRPGRTELGLLILYYLGLHCLMPVEERYFTSLWPLAAAAAAG